MLLYEGETKRSHTGYGVRALYIFGTEKTKKHAEVLTTSFALDIYYSLLL